MPKLNATLKMWEQADSVTLSRFYDLIKRNSILHPERVGPYQPLEHDFSALSTDTLSRIAINERSLVAQRDQRPAQVIFCTNRSGVKKPNVFSHSIEDVKRGSAEAETFCDYVFGLFGIFNPVYGRLCHQKEYQGKNLIPSAVGSNAVGINLRKHLPGIYWANFFGPRYIEFFGEDRLMSAPAHEVRWLGDAGILLLVSESPFDYGKPDVKEAEQAVVEHLGPDAFFFKSDPDDKTYRQPDLSDLPQFAPETNGPR